MSEVEIIDSPRGGVTLTRTRWWPASASLATGIALTLAGPASLAWGADSSATVGSAGLASSPLVTIKLQSASLIDALRSLTQDADIVIANEEGLKDKTVSISLKDKPVEEALDKLLTPINIAWYQDEDGTYIVNATRPRPSPSSLTGPVSLLPPAPEVSPLRKYMVTEKIDLRNISPQEALAALGLPPTGYDGRRTESGSYSSQIGDYQGAQPHPGIPGLYEGNSGLRPSNPNVLIDPSNGGVDVFVPLGNGSAGDDFNRAPGERDGFGQGPTAGRRPGFTPNPNLPRGPNQPPGAPGAQGTTGAGTAGTAARGFLPPGIELVAGLMTDNSLMVLGPPDDIDELRSTIRLLDVAPGQISIKVDIITVTTGALRQFGATYNFFSRGASVDANAGGAPSGAGGLTIDIIRGNVQAVIGALTSNNRGRIIASPLVTTQNNTPATISQGTQTPVFVPQVLQSQGGIVTNTLVQYVSAQTFLVVVPRINRDGSITVQGSVGVNDILQFISSPDGSQIAPQLTQTNLQQFVRRVVSGETLVIGGLNRKQESEQESRVPLLGDIPLIGKLFRSRTRRSDDSQLLIFLTPQTVGDRPNVGETPP